jgi:hypothetical protein
MRCLSWTLQTNMTHCLRRSRHHRACRTLTRGSRLFEYLISAQFLPLSRFKAQFRR